MGSVNVRKFVRRQMERPLISEPSVLVFEEKNGKRHFYIENDEALFATALKVLRERNKDGYWWYKPKAPEALDITEEQIPNLPKSLQDKATEALKEYKEALRAFERDDREYQAIQKAIREKNGQMAWQLLYARRKAEYEAVEIETCEKV